MVIDLRSLGDQRYQVPFAESPELHTDEQKEVARTYTACYLLCSSIGITFGRPNVLRYGPWVHDCIRMLDSPSAAHIGDRRLVAWVRLQRIVEESLSLIGQDEGSQIDYLDGHTRLILQGGFERAKDWRTNLPEDIMNKDVVSVYSGDVMQNVPQFSDVVRHIKRRPISETLTFWTSVLHGVEPCQIPVSKLCQGDPELDIHNTISIPFESMTGVTEQLDFLQKLQPVARDGSVPGGSPGPYRTHQRGNRGIVQAPVVFPS
ncbi:hypothetical protein HZS61_007688 [Fusarium oxysporum f. sp. conglutinans]|uniref:Uncharacterized protein n=1 Tax=Fusarium oxysporum f. sp. conglutinans TaxID=100902 RepID=A0A8H6LAM7_FUSOX|nr:hypothetical protein HZS61_007688 [Fusarium oxysporum f. sp. conglutinans]